MVWYARYDVSVHRSCLHCHRFPSRGRRFHNTRTFNLHIIGTRFATLLDSTFIRFGPGAYPANLPTPAAY